MKLNVPCDIYLFSDGVYEIEKPDNNIWELNEMCQFIANNRTSDCKEIDKLHEYVVEMSGKTILDDDFSMVKISIK